MTKERCLHTPIQVPQFMSRHRSAGRGVRRLLRHCLSTPAVVYRWSRPDPVLPCRSRGAAAAAVQIPPIVLYANVSFSLIR